MLEQTPLAIVADSRLPFGLGGCWYGVYPALVTNIVDPQGQGRVKVKLPWAIDSGEAEYEAWARLATLMGGNNRGSWFIPEKDDEVLICFEAGNPRSPYVIGALWNGQDKPPQTMDQEGMNNPKVLRSRNGIKITLDDTSEKEMLTLETPKGQKVILKDELASVILETTGGQKVTLKDEPASLILTTQGGQKVTLKDEPASVIIETTLGQKATLMDEPPSIRLADSLGNSITSGETGIVLESMGNTVELGESGVSIIAASALELTATADITISTAGVLSIEASEIEIAGLMMTVEAAMTEFVGVVNTPSLIAESVVSPTYSPGVGNIL